MNRRRKLLIPCFLGLLCLLCSFYPMRLGAQAGDVLPAQNWNRVRILDLNSMPWVIPPKAPEGWKLKNIHTIESTGGGINLVFIPPNWAPKDPRHYDKANGWYYFLSGETSIIYYRSPQDQVGEILRFRPGQLFTGVEGAIHGFGPQVIVPDGCVVLDWHDRRPVLVPIPFDYKETTFNGRPWPFPKTVDTRDEPWEKSAEGYIVKKLYDVNGATVELRYYAPEWRSSGPMRYADFDRWMYVLNGAFDVRAYEWPGDSNAKLLHATKGQVVEIPVHSIFGGGNTIEPKDIGAWVLVWRERGGKEMDVP